MLWGGLGEILGAALGAQEGPKSSTFTEARKSRRFLAKKKVVEGKLRNQKIAKTENHDEPRRESLHIYEGLKRAVQNHS